MNQAQVLDTFYYDGLEIYVKRLVQYEFFCKQRLLTSQATKDMNTQDPLCAEPLDVWPHKQSTNLKQKQNMNAMQSTQVNICVRAPCTRASNSVL